MKRGTRSIMMVVMALALVCGLCYLGWLWFLSLMGPPDTTTDIDEYADIRARWGELAEHFPSELPANARDVRLEFFPGFLQGGANFQVHMALPPERIQKLDVEFSSRATHTFRGGDTNDHMNEPGGVPTTFYYTGDTGHTEFPDRFAIYVLQATPAGGTGYEWNHGSNAGVAISPVTNEIVYWCTSW